jgi:hypothetical protein
VQGVLAQLPWWHQIALLEKVADPEARRWYARSAIQHESNRNRGAAWTAAANGVGWTSLAGTVRSKGDEQVNGIRIEAAGA